MTFEELGLTPELLRAIAELGFAQPMPVQEEVIPYLLGKNNDVVALAQTGTGKTAAYGLPLIQKTEVERREPQSLVLCPTRELCLQIAGDLTDYSKYVSGLRVLPVYGGSSIESQIRALRQGVHIIVATPGRLLDLMRRNTVSLATVQNVVLDEADEMLDMGFSEDLDAILADVPDERNTLLFSATMSNEIAAIAKKYLHEPKEITIGRRNEGTANVRHVAYCVHAKDKYEALKRVVDFYPQIYAIIFCRTRQETREVADKLMQEGYNADALHGDLSQAQRDTVMQKFRIRNLQLLVATDVAARGLDVDDLTHVINYGLPDDQEVYTHRSGRTGRAGKTGTSIAIVNMRERGKVKQIQRTIGKEFEWGVMPTATEICEQQLLKVIDDLEKVKVDEEHIAAFMPDICRKLDWLSKEDLIKRVVSHEFNRFAEYYRGREEIETVTEKPKRNATKRERQPHDGDRQAEPGYERLFINVGKKDGINPGELMSLLNRNIRNRVRIGRIDLLPKFSFFEVEEGEGENVVRAMAHATWNGRRVGVELVNNEHRASDKEYRASDNAQGSSDNDARRMERGKRKDYGEAWPRRSDKSGMGREEQRPNDRRADAYGPTRTPAEKQPAKRKPSREERGYTQPRGRKDDWKRFFEHNDELRGPEPDFSEEGWAKRKKK